MPVPPPSALYCAKSSRNTSATTHVPMAKYGPAQAEDDEGGRQRNRRRDQPGKQDRQHRVEAGQDDQPEQAVGAEADEGLLADRHQPGKAGEQVPVLRQAEHGEHEEQVLDQRAPGDERDGEQDGDEYDAGNRRDARRAGAGGEAVAGSVARR